MITKDKVTEIFCIIDEFDKNLSAELAKTRVYRPITVTANATETARADSRKVRL